LRATLVNHKIATKIHQELVKSKEGTETNDVSERTTILIFSLPIEDKDKQNVTQKAEFDGRFSRHLLPQTA